MQKVARSISDDSADAKGGQTDATADLATWLGPRVVCSSTALVLLVACRTVGLLSAELQTRKINKSASSRNSDLSPNLSRGYSHERP